MKKIVKKKKPAGKSRRPRATAARLTRNSDSEDSSGPSTGDDCPAPPKRSNKRTATATQSVGGDVSASSAGSSTAAPLPSATSFSIPGPSFAGTSDLVPFDVSRFTVPAGPSAAALPQALPPFTPAFDALLSASTLRKIQKDRYVNYSHLLAGVLPRKPSSKCFTLENDCIVLKDTDEDQEVPKLTALQWVHAHSRFSLLRAKNDPQLLHALLIYQNSVTDMALSNSWEVARLYDWIFRSERGSKGNDSVREQLYPWTVPHQSSYFKATNRYMSFSRFPLPTHFSTPSRPSFSAHFPVSRASLPPVLPPRGDQYSFRPPSTQGNPSSNQPSSGKKPCSYFFTSRGCVKGRKCGFSHVCSKCDRIHDFRSC